ncbi:hypothetical protein [Xanthobacter sp. 126]|uniref:hypothetical protein n=1 Tax=Xanthobacter sp. 126 TaxID=1131814 RepID=UPI0004B4B433|nr:hypothetical protein [Xanthobacter sp. 126]
MSRRPLPPTFKTIGDAAAGVIANIKKAPPMDVELIRIEQQNALAVFTTPNALDPYLNMVRKEIDAFEPDISTAKGRADVKSFAFKITKVKTYLDGTGKALNDAQKEIPKKIDAARKHARDTLDAWAEEVRKPLTDWEETEEQRVAAHKAAIARIEQLGAKSQLQIPAAEMRAALDELNSIVIGPDCEEYEAAYGRAKEIAVFQLDAGIEARERYEAEQAELAELRRQMEERQRRDREERIAREAAEKAKRDAEEKAAADARRAEEAARREREAAEAREQELKRQAEAAEQRARETEARVKREAEQAKAAEAAAAARREANKRHREKVHRDAARAIEGVGIPSELAARVVDLIATGQVPHVAITY